MPSTISFENASPGGILSANWRVPKGSGTSSIGDDAGLEFRLPASFSGGIELRLHGYRFVGPGQPATMTVVVNGVKLAESTFQDLNGKTTNVLVPASVLARRPGGDVQVELLTPRPLTRQAVYGGTIDPATQPALGYYMKELIVEKLPVAP